MSTISTKVSSYILAYPLNRETVATNRKLLMPEMKTTVLLNYSLHLVKHLFCSD